MGPADVNPSLFAEHLVSMETLTEQAFWSWFVEGTCLPLPCSNYGKQH